MSILGMFTILLGICISMELCARIHYYSRKNYSNIERIKFIFLGKWLINDEQTSPLYLREIATWLDVDTEYMVDVLSRASGKEKETIRDLFINSSGKKSETVNFHPIIGFTPSPNIDLNHLKTNNLGFRGENWDYHKPHGIKRIIILGGSVSFGRSATANEFIISEQLEKKLNSQSSDAASAQKWEVINLSVPDFISYQEFIILTKIGLKFHPDIVISFSGVNDPHHYLDTGMFNEPASFRRIKTAYDAFWGSPLKRTVVILSGYSVLVYYLNQIINMLVKKQEVEELSPFMYTIW